MPIETVPALLQDLERAHLLEANQLEEARTTLAAKFTEPRPLLVELVRRGWLTPFQANHISQGKAGELVLGQYVLLDRIGEGGMGQVFKARHRLMRRVVALKLIRPDRLTDPSALNRFRQEIQAAARLAHPHIVLAHDANEVDGKHFLTMEYIEGTDLGKLIKQHGPLPVALACDYIRQAALGLQHAHEQGMVHRDIKPSNLLLAQTGGPQTYGSLPAGVVKVMDLGLARLRSEEARELTQTGAMMGTADYVAPEQASDASRADIRSDIYSLGCTLYFLLSGQPPFAGGTVMEKLFAHCQTEPEPIEKRRPDMPAGLVPVVRKMMAKKPDARYQTPADVVQALDPMCHHGEIKEAALLYKQAPAWSLVVEPGSNGKSSSGPTNGSTLGIRLRPSRRWPWVVGAVALAGMCSCPVLGWVLWRSEGPTSSRAVATTPKDEPVFVNSLGMKLVRITPGKFLMGSPEPEKLRSPNETPQHEVTLTKPFYMGAYEVTVAEFRAFVRETSYQTDAQRDGRGALRFFPAEKKFLPDPQCTWQNPGWPQEDNFPVVCVSWNDARAFCEWLTQKERKQGRTYRLPTEAEWEYACRAGTTSMYAFGDSLSSFQANFQGDYPHGGAPRGPNLARTTKVGSFTANPFGLYDMHGNATEWTADFYQNRYPAKPQTDPTGPTREDSTGDRVYRGGSWFDPGNLCRSSQRGRNPEKTAINVIGFRVACTVP